MSAKAFEVYGKLELPNGLLVQVVDVRPVGDVFVTSAGAGGDPGQLSSLVLTAAGMDPSTLPSHFQAGTALLTHGKTPVLVVQSVGIKPTKALLPETLAQGLTLLQRVSGAETIYLPLLGTGTGRLSPRESAAIILNELARWERGSFTTALLAAPSVEVAHELVRVFDMGPSSAGSNDLVTECVALASLLAERAGRTEGADGALLLAAILLHPASLHETDSVWDEPLNGGSKDARIKRALASLGLQAIPEKPPEGWGPGFPKPMLAAEAQQVVKTAAELGELGLGQPLGGLLVALLVPPERGGPLSVGPFLRQAGISPTRLRAFFRAQKWTGEPAALAAALALLEEHSPRVAQRGVYANDQPRGEDQLEIGNDVAALADVIAAAERTPPLAVGLFGDWGSGKSFFINQLKNRLDAVTDSAKAALKEGQPTAYCARVVHVDFNAWQYIDGNLWANLVYRVFEGLSTSLFETQKVREAATVEEQRKMLFSNLALSREQLAENEHEKAAADAAMKKAEEQRSALEAKRDAASKRLQSPSGADVMKTVLAVPATANALKKFHDLWGQSGAQDVVTELREAHSELSSTWGRTISAFRRLSQKSPLYLLLFALALVLAWAAPIVLNWLDLRVDELALRVPALVAAATSLLGPLSRYLDDAKRALSAVEKAERQVNQELEKQQERATEQRDLAQKEVSEANLQLLKIEEHERTVRQRIGELEAEIARISAGHRVREFIRERSAGTDYRQHLGIVSTIRNDFEHLKDLLASVQKEETVTGDIPIQRIVLYVDDLDRCPADRVVEVLQAVNLLLDFPLFVAVVAVDARWLLKSLSAHYSPQLGSHQPGNGVETAWASTPQNFLEKIFQIPLTLRPMDRDGYQRLVRALLPVTDEVRATPPSPSAQVPQPAGAASTQAGAPAKEASAAPNGPPNGAAVPPPSASNSPPPDPGPPAPTKRLLDANPEVLQIKRREREFLERLSAVVSTPRAVKRLINLYWLTRASLREHEVEEFVGTPEAPGSFRQHMVLLALMVGYPSQIGALFEALLEKGTNDVQELTSQLRARLEAPNAHSNANETPHHFCDHFTRLVKGEKLPTDAAAYHRPIERVVRFSFRPARLPGRHGHQHELSSHATSGA